jgi:hypothetical protein
VLPPLLLLLLDDVLVRQRRNPLLTGAALGALAAAQLLIGEELLAFTGIAAAAMLVAQLVLFPRRVPAKAGHAVGGLAAAAVVFAVLAAWPLAHQLLGPQRIAGDIQESSRNGNDLYSFVVPTRVMAVTPAAALEVSGRFVGRVGELNGDMGAPLVTVVLFTAVRWWRGGVVRVAFLTGLVMLVLSMGERLHVNGQILDTGLPWAAMKSLRAPAAAVLHRPSGPAHPRGQCRPGGAVPHRPGVPGHDLAGHGRHALSHAQRLLRRPGHRRHSATMVRFVSELLRAPPERVDGVWVWWDVQPRSLGHQPTAGRC